MIKKLLAFAVAASLFFSANNAQAASIEGSACKQIGKVVSSAKIKYECSKSKVWKVLKPKAEPPKLALSPKVVLQKIVPVSIPTMPPMPLEGTYKLTGNSWDSSKSEFTVALFADPVNPEFSAQAKRIFPLSLQKIANATGNTFTILDTSNIPPTPITKDRKCSDVFSDIDVIIVSATFWTNVSDKPTIDDHHGVSTTNSTKGKINCNYVKINPDGDWGASEDFSTTTKSIGRTFMHEIGHSFGLAHTDNRKRPICPQIMGECSNGFSIEYQSGDLYGLYLVTQGKR